MPIYFTQSYFENPFYSFTKKFTFFPLVVFKNPCDKASFCVKSKAKIHFTVSLLQRSKPFASGYLMNHFVLAFVLVNMSQRNV